MKRKAEDTIEEVPAKAVSEKDKEFNELIQSIENNTFVGNKITICGLGPEESRKEDALDDNKVIILANALKKNSNITNLDLGFNIIGDKGSITLATLNTIDELNLEGNNIKIEGAIALAKGNFKKLNLGINLISCNSQGEGTNDEKEELIEAFAHNKTLENLNLEGCYLEEEKHGEIIGKIIGRNTSIRTLILISNKLGDKILEHIGNNTILERLSLDGNNITDKGAEHMFQNYGLKEVDFGRESTLTEVGGKLLSGHSTLKFINLNNEGMTIEQLRELFPQEIIENNTENNDTNYVDLSGNINYDE